MLMTRATHWDALDGLRGVAVALVVFAHLSESGMTGGLKCPSAGTVGVYIFFVLSSFLLSRPFVDDPGALTQPARLWRYAIRRAARIYPLYLLALGLYFGLSQAGVTGPEQSLYMSAQDLLWHLLLQEGKAYLWTIRVEVTFYLLLPLLLLVYLTLTGGRVLRISALSLIIVAIAAWQSHSHSVPATTLIVQFPTFLLGCVAAILSTRDPSVSSRDRPPTPGYLPLVLVGLAVMSLPELSAGTPFGHLTESVYRSTVVFVTLHACIWSALVYLVVTGRACLLTGVLSTPWLRGVGAISFSIYIWHVPVLAACRRVDLLTNTFLGAALTVAVTLGISLVSYRWIERPVYLWAHQPGRGSTPAEAYR